MWGWRGKGNGYLGVGESGEGAEDEGEEGLGFHYDGVVWKGTLGLDGNGGGGFV